MCASKSNARPTRTKKKNSGCGENCNLFCYKGAGETRACFILIPPRRRAEKVSFVALTKRGVLSVIFNFDIAVNLVSAQAAGAHTFVPCDKSMQKRTCAGSPKVQELPPKFEGGFYLLPFPHSFKGINHYLSVIALRFSSVPFHGSFPNISI